MASARPRPGLAARLVGLAEALRAEGLAVGTSELLDAVSALELVDWTQPGEFRGALGATLAKSREDRHVFDQVFDSFMFRQVEGAALESASAAGGRGGEQRQGGEQADGGSRVDMDELRKLIHEALARGDLAALSDLARLAAAAAADTAAASGVVGIDLQRIRRELELTSQQSFGDLAAAPGVRDAQRMFEAELRRQLERAQIERTGRLPPARPLTELNRTLAGGSMQDLAAVQRVAAQLRRRLATHGHQHGGMRRHAHVDFRRTARASLQTGGVPVILKYRPRRPRRPELIVLCDVSTSVSSASVFFLSVLHALHDSFRRMRSFVFVERVAEVTEIFEREKSFESVAQRISSGAGVADVSGYTDYGRVWSELLGLVEGDLDPRSTLIVLGDARTNGRDPGTEAFAELTRRVGRAFWLNPEPRLYWDHGDSVISRFEPHCSTFECWTPRQLEQFARVLVNPSGG